MSEPNAIEARGVVKIFGSGAQAVTALDRVSITVRENEFFTLLGPSGCGKTTLLRLIAGFEQPSEGEIFLAGEAIGHLPPFKRPVNTVFQSYALFPHMSVAENVGFGLMMLGRPKDAVATRVAEMLALVKMSQLAQRQIAQLSGGQQQRVALARALANDPKVLLLDEPLSALDLKLRKEMQLELKRLQRETGITFVFVTHDQEEALTMSDRIAVMNEGRVLQVGTPLDIYENPRDRFVADFIGETNFFEARVETASDGEIVCQLAGGMRLTLPGRAQAGSRLVLAVRPEKLELSAQSEGAGEGQLQGSIADRVYQGTRTAYHVALDGGERLVVSWANHQDGRLLFEPGQRVSVTLPPGVVRILEP